MKSKTLIASLFCILCSAQHLSAQNAAPEADKEALADFRKKSEEIEKQRISDSIWKAGLEHQLGVLKATNDLQKERLLLQLEAMEKDAQHIIDLKKQKIDSLKLSAKGYPVIGIYNDTLLLIYSKAGSSMPQERAFNISKRIEALFEDDFLRIDSIKHVDSENAVEIVYGEIIIMHISETDALWHNMSKHDLAQNYTEIIKHDLANGRSLNRVSRVSWRIGLSILVLSLAVLLLWLINKGFRTLTSRIGLNKDKWLRNLEYKGYTFLSASQEYKGILLLMRPVQWFIFALVLYLVFLSLFSIFPFTRSWGIDLFDLIWRPVKGIAMAVWDYIPDLITVLVIYFTMKYVIRLVRYIFSEIESDKLKIDGFHADWASPTFSIVKMLLYAFTFVVMFPYLPGSDSTIFKGVSVFLGILFSLGSSTAIANVVAGLVITYMRPFRIGDRIRIGEVFGDVEEKTLLVTRIKTTKNEIVTIPNSAVLSGNTINYSSEIEHKGLILHTTVTIGYDVPWKEMHSALIEAALRTECVLQEPPPFVLQTALDDFYVSYQINAYTREVKKQAFIYSHLHQNIQDVCNERGIEILSPHYRAQRDGNMTTIPAAHLPPDYKAPGFNISIPSK